MLKCLSTALLVLIGALGMAQSPYTVIQTDAERDLIPEGIAIDSRTKTIYVSSINKNKIIAVDMNGKSRDFITSGQDGILSVLGMTVDTTRNWLWAISIIQEDSLYSSKVHAFDLKTAKTMQQYLLKDTSTHLLNDLVMMGDGNIYLTDSYFSAIYKLDPRTKSLSQFIKSDLIPYPNGIAGWNNHLVIATNSNGIVNLDLSDKSIKRMPGIKDTSSANGLDGLVLRDGRLFGVFNGNEDNRKNAIMQFTLNTTADSVVSATVLDRGNKYFAEPTTAAYSDGQLFVVANSHLGAYFKNNTSAKGIEDKLKPVTILVYSFKL